VEILSQVIPQAKTVVAAARGAESQSLRKVDSSLKGHTVDTAVPDRVSDLVNLIDERMGKLEYRSSTSKFSRQVARIETVRQDPRYAFRFDNATVGSDTMAEVVGQLFRLPANGQPMTVMQLAGFPSEVVDSLVSVRGRMAFDFGLWSDGAVPLLFVCEEAHRYAPGDKSIGFGPTRKAISFGERARPEHHPLSRFGRGRKPAGVPALARHTRGVRLRRGRGPADALALQRAAPRT
jgi:hypothetical protein